MKEQLKNQVTKFQSEIKKSGYSSVVITHKIAAIRGENELESHVSKRLEMSSIEDDISSAEDINAAIAWANHPEAKKQEMVVLDALRIIWETVAAESAHTVIADLAKSTVANHVKGLDSEIIIKVMNKVFNFEDDNMQSVVVKGAIGMLHAAIEELEQEL